MPAELATTLTATEAQRLEQAEGLVRAYCGWHISPSRSGVTLTLTEAVSVALVPSLHVTAVTVADIDGTIYDADDYIWTAAGVVSRCSWWPAGTVLTYTHGYPEVPPEVTGVVQAIAQRAIGNPTSLSSQTTGPFSASYSSSAPLSLLLEERVVLDRYKLPPRP